VTDPIAADYRARDYDTDSNEFSIIMRHADVLWTILRKVIDLSILETEANAR
jgi:hypothetical protein